MITIELDKSRELQFSTFALMEVEAALGKNFLRDNIFKNLSMRDLTYMVWAALWHEDESITIKQVAKLIPSNNPQKSIELMDKLMDAWCVYNGIDPSNKNPEKKTDLENISKGGKSSKRSQ